MTESLGKDVRPRSLNIDPVTEKSAGNTQEHTPSKPERIDPESEYLPGNIGWTNGIRDALAKKKDRLALWATTSIERMGSAAEASTIASARVRESAFTKRADQFSRREAHHAQELARLEVRSGIWNLPVARQITSAQAVYHSWREGINARKASRADAKAERASKQAEKAEEYQKYFDGKIAARVDAVNARWQAKLDTVRKPREHIDAAIAQIGEVIVKNEALLAKIREKVHILENTTGGDRKARRKQLSGLYKSLQREETALKEKHKDLVRKQKHRVRLAVAEDSVEAAMNELTTRYKNHERWEPGTAGLQSSPNTERISASSATESLTWSLRELAESKGTISNEQMGKLWDSLFPHAKLPQGFKTLVALRKAAFPGTGIVEAPDAMLSIREFLETLPRLYEKSAEFQKLVARATSRRGTKGIENLIGHIETHVAFAESIDTI